MHSSSRDDDVRVLKQVIPVGPGIHACAAPDAVRIHSQACNRRPRGTCPPSVGGCVSRDAGGRNASVCMLPVMGLTRLRRRADNLRSTARRVFSAHLVPGHHGQLAHSRGVVLYLHLVESVRLIPCGSIARAARRRVGAPRPVEEHLLNWAR